MKTMLPAFLILLAAGCKDDEITRVKVPKEAPASMGSSMMGGGGGMTGGDMAGGEASERPRGLSWTKPAGWTEEAGNGMRVATLKPASGKAEATVVALPGDAGGELANVNRWRGQIALGPIEQSGLASARKTLRSKAGDVALYDFTSDGKVKTRLVAAAIKTGETTWFFKLMGDAKAVAAARPAYVKMLEGLRPDAP